MASADVSSKYVREENGPDYPLDVHSLFFVYLPQQHTGRKSTVQEDPDYIGFRIRKVDFTGARRLWHKIIK